MLHTTAEQRRQQQGVPRHELERHQLSRLNELLTVALPHNRFYGEKLAGCTTPLTSLADLKEFPYTFKDELSAVRDQEWGANLTYPVEQYTRFHRTSGTRGRPLVVLDTPIDWQWWIECWQYTLDAAEIKAGDRVVLAFSFGPFIGFWSAHDALNARGVLTIPTGGLSTLARLELIRSMEADALLCTPSYALHIAEVARENQIDVAGSNVRRIVVAGEPGGSVPAVRRQIETAWNARVIDHAGASEVGPWGYSDRKGRGLHVLEAEFLPEFRALDSGEDAKDGELAELVLTSLGRYGSPVIRYRTGDVVRPRWNSTPDNCFVLLDGGVVGRVDDMLIVRGVNVFPTAVDAILRSFPEVVEYRVLIQKQGALDTLTIEVEDRLNAPERIVRDLRLRIGLTVEVRCVPLGSLPRFEGKGKRFVDQRS